jgi:hypothetical protein
LEARSDLRTVADFAAANHTKHVTLDQWLLPPQPRHSGGYYIVFPEDIGITATRELKPPPFLNWLPVAVQSALFARVDRITINTSLEAPVDLGTLATLDDLNQIFVGENDITTDSVAYLSAYSPSVRIDRSSDWSWGAWGALQGKAPDSIPHEDNDGEPSDAPQPRNEAF